MVKSSEVLRLVAEYAFNQELPSAMWRVQYLQRADVMKYLAIVDLDWTLNQKDACMALCLAAAIAEDEGD